MKQGYEPESIINSPEFGRNPFAPIHREEKTYIAGNAAKIKEYISENYLSWDFSSLLNCTEQCGSAVFYVEFVLEKNDIFDLLSQEKHVLCTDGRIKSITPKNLMQYAHLTSSRDEIYSLMNACNEYMRKQCGINEGNPLIIGAHFSAGIHKNGKPTHLFTQEEIGEAMRQADDRVHNVLVIDEDGYAHVISDVFRALSYPVRHEIWNAGNCYVGKYSDLRTLGDMYVQSLEGWYDYLTHGHRVYKDYIDGTLTCNELIQKIREESVL